MGRPVRTTAESADRIVRLFGALVCLVVMLVGLAPSTAYGRQSDADGRETDGQASYSVTATVDGDTVIIALADLSTPVGALELELLNVPTMANDECILASGLGACAQTDDGVRIVALNPTGWQESTVLLELEFTGPATDAELVIGRGTDVSGIDLVGMASTTVAPSSSGGSGTSWLIPAAIALIVGLLVVGGRKMRVTRPNSDPE